VCGVCMSDVSVCDDDSEVVERVMCGVWVRVRVIGVCEWCVGVV
jgi:hypothetical protein